MYLSEYITLLDRAADVDLSLTAYICVAYELIQSLGRIQTLVALICQRHPDFY